MPAPGPPLCLLRDWPVSPKACCAQYHPLRQMAWGEAHWLPILRDPSRLLDPMPEQGVELYFGTSLPRVQAQVKLELHSSPQVSQCHQSTPAWPWPRTRSLYQHPAGPLLAGSAPWIVCRIRVRSFSLTPVPLQDLCLSPCCHPPIHPFNKYSLSSHRYQAPF